jgi:hypothetical protein
MSRKTKEPMCMSVKVLTRDICHSPLITQHCCNGRTTPHCMHLEQVCTFQRNITACVAALQNRTVPPPGCMQCQVAGTVPIPTRPNFPHPTTLPFTQPAHYTHFPGSVSCARWNTGNGGIEGECNHARTFSLSLSHTICLPHCSLPLPTPQLRFYHCHCHTDNCCFRHHLYLHNHDHHASPLAPPPSSSSLSSSPPPPPPPPVAQSHHFNGVAIHRRTPLHTTHVYPQGVCKTQHRARATAAPTRTQQTPSLHPPRLSQLRAAANSTSPEPHLKRRAATSLTWLQPTPRASPSPSPTSAR